MFGKPRFNFKFQSHLKHNILSTYNIETDVDAQFQYTLEPFAQPIIHSVCCVHVCMTSCPVSKQLFVFATEPQTNQGSYLANHALIELSVARVTPLHHTFGACRPMQQRACHFRSQYKKQTTIHEAWKCCIQFYSPQSGEQEHSTAMKGFYTRQTFEHPACKYNPINFSAVDERYAGCCDPIANLPAHVYWLLNTCTAAFLDVLLANCLCSVWGGAYRPQVGCLHHTPSPHTTEPHTTALARSFGIHDHQMLALVSRMQLQRCSKVSSLHNVKGNISASLKHLRLMA